MTTINRNHILGEKVNNKLRRNAGESLAETLVALLISALAIVMLAGAIATATRLVTSSKNKLKTYYSNNEKLAKMNEAGEAAVISVEGSSGGTKITYYTNDDFGSKREVIAYRKSN